MKQFILQYWLEALFTLIISCLGMWCKMLNSKLKEKTKEQEALKSGMIAILHDRLFHICNYYLSLGYIPVDKSEEVLDNAKIIYEAYHGIGGNSTGTVLYEKLLKLKVQKPDSEEEDGEEEV